MHMMTKSKSRRLYNGLSRVSLTLPFASNQQRSLSIARLRFLKKTMMSNFSTSEDQRKLKSHLQLTKRQQTLWRAPSYI